MKVQSRVWTGKRVLNLMFGNSHPPVTKKAVKKATPTTKTSSTVKKMQPRASKEVVNTGKQQKMQKTTAKPVKAKNWNEFASAGMKAGKNLKVLGKEWQKVKGGTDGKE